MRPAIFYSALFLLTLVSCDESRVFEKNQDIKQNTWVSNDTIQFETTIEDTAPKNIYLNFRHDFSFAWRNAWLTLEVTTPSDSMFAMPVNLPLSQPDGQWYGECSGDICNLQFPLKEFTGYSFSEQGLYSFALSHEMREDPLNHVLSVGIRIENVLKEN